MSIINHDNYNSDDCNITIIMVITVMSVAVSIISSILAAAQSSSLGYNPDCLPQYLDGRLKLWRLQWWWWQQEFVWICGKGDNDSIRVWPCPYRGTLLLQTYNLIWNDFDRTFEDLDWIRSDFSHLSQNVTESESKTWIIDQYMKSPRLVLVGGN